jgi:hypothetical protein
MNKGELNQNSEFSVYKEEISARVEILKKEISSNALRRRPAFQKQS